MSIRPLSGRFSCHRRRLRRWSNGWMQQMSGSCQVICLKPSCVGWPCARGGIRQESVRSSTGLRLQRSTGRLIVLRVSCRCRTCARSTLCIWRRPYGSMLMPSSPTITGWLKRLQRPDSTSSLPVLRMSANERAGLRLGRVPARQRTGAATDGELWLSPLCGGVLPTLRDASPRRRSSPSPPTFRKPIRVRTPPWRLSGARYAGVSAARAASAPVGSRSAPRWCRPPW